MKKTVVIALLLASVWVLADSKAEKFKFQTPLENSIREHLLFFIKSHTSCANRIVPTRQDTSAHQKGLREDLATYITSQYTDDHQLYLLWKTFVKGGDAIPKEWRSWFVNGAKEAFEKWDAEDAITQQLIKGVAEQLEGEIRAPVELRNLRFR